MPEHFKPNPSDTGHSEAPASEENKDIQSIVDGLHEEIAARLDTLALSSENTQFIRSYRISLDSGAAMEVQLTTQDGSTQGISFTIQNNGEPRSMATIFKSSDGYSFNVVSGSIQEGIRPFMSESPTELPAGFNGLIEFIRRQGDDSFVDLDGDEVDALAGGLSQDCDALGAPVHYSTFITLPENTGFVEATATLADLLGDHDTGETNEPVSIMVGVKGDFEYRVANGTEKFVDEKAIGAYELTEEDRSKKPPYIVVPTASYISQLEADGRYWTGDDELIGRHPTEGFMVVSAQVDGSVSSAASVYFPTETEARQYADAAYANDIARYLYLTNPQNITPERLKRVVKALDKAIAEAIASKL